jgi:DNA-directed RNA polymerase specialized sigma24 family protein
MEKPMRPMTTPSDRDRIRDALLQHPELLERLRNMVRKSVPEIDVDDVFQTSWVKAREAKDLPLEQGPCIGFVLTIGHHTVVDYWRKRGGSREMPVEDLEYVAAACPQESISARLLVQKFAADEDMDEDRWQTFVWLARTSIGETVQKIADEMDIDYFVVHKRISKLKKDLRQKAIVWGGGIAFVALLVGTIWFYVLRPKPEIAHDKEKPAPTLNELAPSAPPMLPPPPPELSPAMRARTLRALAYRDCVDVAWASCLQLLNEAKAIDPDGEKDPLVKAARSDATEGVKHGSKTWMLGHAQPYEKEAAPPLDP